MLHPLIPRLQETLTRHLRLDIHKRFTQANSAAPLQKRSSVRKTNENWSNFSLQQSCSNLATNLTGQECKLETNLTRQECKLETSYRKRVSQKASNLSQACRVKLIGNYSKNQIRIQPRIRTRDISFPKPDVLILATQPFGQLDSERRR
ncbi:hypothetical protein AVEN_245595-1 [Araneus ventricosus]|uniref:Uncharacterized protein n=1 Tax=Araneus ventricosus TaxID=182803 RepID=A0A4Y2U3P4_ARAVE|nr:hypothetical protein AVEN_245595-1 [Araneus ventricosus]